jgi:hypothetical protein
MEFEYDCNGNIFLKNSNDYYILNIDKNDDICFDKIYNKIYVDEKIKSKEIKTNILNKLHSITMKNTVEEIDKNLDLEEFDEDEVQEIADTYNDININPEYESYNNNIYELDNECYNDDEDNQFDIFTNFINCSELIYEPPSFETIIYKNNIIQLRTQLINNQPFYRISIQLEEKSDNKLEIKLQLNLQLNIIGTKIKYYNFNLNTLEINKLNESTIKIM